MTASPNLSLPYILAGQAQKEVTHNDALNDLDSLSQISVIDMTTNAPPGSPAEGDSYIIGSSPTGAWAGSAGKIASYYSGWRIKTPEEGWVAWVQDVDRSYVFDGSNWVSPSQSIAASGYLNFGAALDASGYGFRDNAGAIEFKDSGGSWAALGSGGGSGTVNSGTSGQIAYYASSSDAVSGNANATISSGALTLGVAGATIGKLLLAGNTSGTITMQPQAAAGTYNFNLPTTAGSNGQVLASGGGSGTAMSWTTLAAIATSGSASDLGSGTLSASRLPAFSGDISTSAGSSVTAIGASKVTNTMLAGSIAASKLVGTDIATVGTITSGVWNAGAVTSSAAVTGTQLVPSGSSAPSNGVYLPAANTVGLATNSTQALTIDSAQLALFAGYMRHAGNSFVSSDFSKTSDTSLANITGLSATLAAGKTYWFDIYLLINLVSSAAGGVKVDLNGGSATATSIIGFIYINTASGSNAANNNITALTTSAGTSALGTTTGITRLFGSMTVNAGGTFIPRFAQNGSSANTSTVKAGSVMFIQQVN